MSRYNSDFQPPQPNPAVGGTPVARRHISPVYDRSLTTTSPVTGRRGTLQPREGDTVLVSSLESPAYRGRRVRVRGVEGEVQGVRVKAVLVQRGDGCSGDVPVKYLHLVDSAGEEHEIDFSATETAKITD